MRKKKADLISELKTAENLLLEKHEELLTCQDELARIITEQNQQKSGNQTVPASPNSFRLELFPRGEHAFQSSIEHLLSNESQPLDGLDLEAIVSFIGTYIPIEEIHPPQSTQQHSAKQEPPEETEITEAQHEEATLKAQHEEEIQEAQHEEVTQHEEATQHEEEILETTEVGKTQARSETGSSEVRLHTQVRPLTTMFHTDTPFDLEVSIDPKVNTQTTLESGRCKVSIFSKNLSTGSTTLLGVLNESVEAFEKESTKKISTTGLPQGFYRIEAVSSFTTEDGNQVPIASVNAGSFIHVT